jgi:hypothetical protein
MQPKQRSNLWALVWNTLKTGWEKVIEQIRSPSQVDKCRAVCLDAECRDWADKIVALIQHVEDLEQEYTHSGALAKNTGKLGSLSAINLNS